MVSTTLTDLVCEDTGCTATLASGQFIEVEVYQPNNLGAGSAGIYFPIETHYELTGWSVGDEKAMVALCPEHTVGQNWHANTRCAVCGELADAHENTVCRAEYEA